MFFAVDLNVESTASSLCLLCVSPFFFVLFFILSRPSTAQNIRLRLARTSRPAAETDTRRLHVVVPRSIIILASQ